MRAYFRCIRGCAGELAVDEVVYTCPACGDLLEVAHDMNALKETSGDAWRSLFESRYRSVSLPDASGVWSKREWVMPEVKSENIVSMVEGATPLLDVPGYAAELGIKDVRIKQCGTTHTGSFKDLGMTVLVSMVKQMVANGREIRAVACASTGDTSAALAAYAARAGLRAVVLLPKGKISTAQLVQPLANGALVLALDTDFDGCMKIVRQLAENDGVYLANSMNSLRIEGQKTVSLEIAQQLGWEPPDWVVIPGGNLGNVSALGAGFRMLRELGLTDREPRICVAQAQQANPLYRSYEKGFESFEAIQAGTTLASAIQIGNPVSRDKAISALRRADGIVCDASEEELANASARADRHGLFTCPHTGVALAALEKLVASGTIGKGQRAVVVSTASGLKFADFKVGYHEDRLEAVSAARYANKPIDVADSYEKARDAIAAGLAQ